MDLQAAFDHGFETVKNYLDAEIELLTARLAELATRPIEKGDAGPPGPPGPNGEAGPPGPKGGIDLDAMLPAEIAAEIARAVRTLHEAPALVERSEPAASPKVVRIERDADGNLVPIYDDHDR